MNIPVVLSILISFLILLANGQDFNIAQHLATHSPYFVQGSTTDTPPPSGCSAIPVHFNFIARHGAREPTLSEVIQMTKLQNVLAEYGDCINAPEFQWLKGWINPYTPLDVGELDLIGQQEHYDLAKRFVNRYYPLLSVDYHPLIYPIQSTQVSRTGRSGNAFGYSMLENLGELGPNNYEPFYQYCESPTLDTQLRFFDNCPLYNVSVLRNDSTVYDSKKFLEVNADPISSKVLARLGGQSCQWNITAEQLHYLYTACSYDIAVQNATDLFCSLFDEDDIQVFEYSEDLENFYQQGYGVPLNYEIACLLLQDVFQQFDAVITNDTFQLAKLRFAHAETVMPLVALLGLFDDGEDLHWDSPPTVIESRLWRTSNISPFAANVVFLLYECQDPETPWRVKLLHNENEQLFPYCDELYCDYTVVKKSYVDALTCNFDRICQIN